jgi:hypothetical protein
VCKCVQVWTGPARPSQAQPGPASCGHSTCQQQRGLGRRFDLIPAIWQDVRDGYAFDENFRIR